MVKVIGTCEGEASLEVNLVALPSNQGGGILQGEIVPKPGETAETIYINAGNYDTIKVTPDA